MTRFHVRKQLVAACFLTSLSLACSDHPPIPTSPASFAITSVQPAVGPSDHAAAVTIWGAGFRDGASVMFGDRPATVTAVVGTHLSVTTPVSAPGRVDIVVTNPDGAVARLNAAFTFQGPPVPPVLTISAVSPKEGWPFYYTEIVGTGFQTGFRLTFGGVDVPVSVSHLGTTSFMPPWHEAGPVDVVVTNPDGTSATLPGGFTYKAATLAVSKSVANPGETLVVTWSGPNDPSDFTPPDTVGVYAVDDPSNRPIWYTPSPVGDGFSQNFNAPANPGNYEVRYFMMSQYLLAKVPLTVR